MIMPPSPNRFILAALALIAGLGASPLQAEERGLLILASNTNAYAAEARVGLTTPITLADGEQIRLLMPDGVARVFEGPVRAKSIQDLDGRRRWRWLDIYDTLEEAFTAARDETSAAAARNAEATLAIEGFPFAAVEKPTSAATACVSGDRPALSMPRLKAGQRVAVDIRDMRSSETGGFTLEGPSDGSRWPVSVTSGGRYQIDLKQVGGAVANGKPLQASLLIDVKLVDTAVLAPGEMRIRRLLEAGCGAQAVADAAL